MTPPIAIIGAGPSGLMLGRLLELGGIDYTIFERDLSPREAEQGGTLDIHAETGQLALREGGLMEGFKSLARYDGQRTIIADKAGNIAAKYDIDETGGDLDRPEIDRQDLRKLLLDSVPTQKIRWGSRVQQVTRDENGLISVHTNANHIESGFRLVVGADGAWSKARRMITSILPKYSGIFFMTTAIATNSPLYAKAVTLAGTGNYIAVGSGKQISAQRMGDGSYSVTIGLSLPEYWNKDTELLSDPPNLRRWLLQDKFGDWSQLNTDFIKFSDDKFRAWPLYALPPEALSWEMTPGVTLVGDAAHLTIPSGEGVNCAMFDSLQLAKQILQFGLEGLDEAVKEYEEKMFLRAHEASKGSIEVVDMLLAQDAPDSWVKQFGRGSAV